MGEGGLSKPRPYVSAARSRGNEAHVSGGAVVPRPDQVLAALFSLLCPALTHFTRSVTQLTASTTGLGRFLALAMDGTYASRTTKGKGTQPIGIGALSQRLSASAVDQGRTLDLEQ